MKEILQDDYLVGGELRRWSGPSQDVHSYVSSRFLGRHPKLGEKEALEVLDAAVRAYGSGRGEWPSMTPAERIARVEEFAFRMKEKRGEVVELLMWEIGKSLKDSEKEFDRTLEYVRDTIQAVKELDRANSRFQIEQGVIAQTRRAPLGVVLCMGPFNYPLNETFTTLIPAVVMGNTAVMKPARMGVLLWRPLLDAFRAAFPPGVVNTVYGDGPVVVGPLMASGRIDALAFIGSARVAAILEKQHPKPNRLRTIYGLESKNPAIVLADADLDLAVKECVLGALSFNGQRCTALKILFAHRSVHDAFVAKFCAAVDALKRGMPWDPDVAITPLAEPAAAGRMAELVADAVGKGAKVLNRPGAPAGTLFPPTVVGPVAPGMRLWSEEQFGPVVPVLPFDDVETPIRYLVESPYGQQASLFGRDSGTIARLVDALANQVCRVNLNSQCQRGPDVFPFTGRKDSAEGTLSVTDALRAFSIRSMVAAKEGELNRAVLTAIVRERRSRILSTDFLF